ncbi:PREDICTED: condensin-2 complex subunit D3-like, partial [Tauraco erythrolophus]|uniref:condensin-2 complex subunit D3-like n=1 Tax=Tauraco erythrolophus TaxID=121530 RepID=UPI0005239CB4
WASAVWDLDFTETEPLDPGIAEAITEDGLDAFTWLYQSLSPFAAEDRENRANIWTLFAENNFSHNALVAVLHHFVQAGQHKRADAQQRVYALHAAGLYFLLLEIPARDQLGGVNQLVNLLENVVADDMSYGYSSQDNAFVLAIYLAARANGEVARRFDALSMEEILEEEEEEEEEEDCENVYFSTDDLLQVRNSIFLLLKNFLRLLPKFSLKDKPQCVQNCLQIFVGMTNFEPAVHEFEFSAAMNVNEAKYVPELAYRGLRLLCSPLHGAEDKILRCVFQRILNVILMLESGAGSRRAVLPITSAVISARNQAIKFISSVVDELKEVVFPVLRILLQHICTKVPDKADYRMYAAQALVNLLDKLPCIEFADFIAWLYKYSRNAKIAYRVFALDVALALLDVPERNLDSSLPPDHQKFLKHKFLVQVMVFGRCSDKAPVVRSKALSSFAHCLETKAAATSESIQDLLQSSVSNHSLKTLPTFKSIELTDHSNTTMLD